MLRQKNAYYTMYTTGRYTTGRYAPSVCEGSACASCLTAETAAKRGAGGTRARAVTAPAFASSRAAVSSALVRGLRRAPLPLLPCAGCSATPIAAPKVPKVPRVRASLSVPPPSATPGAVIVDSEPCWFRGPGAVIVESEPCWLSAAAADGPERPCSESSWLSAAIAAGGRPRGCCCCACCGTWAGACFAPAAAEAGASEVCVAPATEAAASEVCVAAALDAPRLGRAASLPPAARVRRLVAGLPLGCAASGVADRARLPPLAVGFSLISLADFSSNAGFSPV